jgi:hypothetical protein
VVTTRTGTSRANIVYLDRCGRDVEAGHMRMPLRRIGDSNSGFGRLRLKEWIARRAATENRMAVLRGVEWFVPPHLKSLLMMEGLL